MRIPRQKNVDRGAPSVFMLAAAYLEPGAARLWNCQGIVILPGGGVHPNGMSGYRGVLAVDVGRERIAGGVVNKNLRATAASPQAVQLAIDALHPGQQWRECGAPGAILATRGKLRHGPGRFPRTILYVAHVDFADGDDLAARAFKFINLVQDRPVNNIALEHHK